MLYQQFGETAADALEHALINGDTSTTHQDSDITDAKDVAKAWKGFRKLALAAGLTSDWSTGGISAANARKLIKLLGVYGKNRSNLFWLAGIQGETDLMGLPELLTIQNAGANATLFTGKVSALYNIPIIPSARCREDLNASGVFDNVTKTDSNIMLINKSRFFLGRRRDVTIETFKDIDTMQTKLVASFRRAFVPMEVPSATITPVAMAIKFPTAG